MLCWSGKPGACTRRLALEDEGRFQSSPLPEYLGATTESRAVDVSVDPERAKELRLVESVEASICCNCRNRSATGRRARSTKNGVPRDSSRRKTSVPAGWQSDRLVTARALHTWASITQSVFAFALPACAKCTLTVLIS